MYHAKESHKKKRSRKKKERGQSRASDYNPHPETQGKGKQQQETDDRGDYDNAFSVEVKLGRNKQATGPPSSAEQRRVLHLSFRC
jgi:hypothetical protein